MRVREELKQEDPLLHQALENSWRIALETWLPTIPPSKGSHSGYPHLYHMELLLDRLVEQFGDESHRHPFKLRPVEKYLILAAILLHDIGKIRNRRNHCKASCDLIIDEGAELGIPSRDLSELIARLARNHDPKGQLPDDLTDISLDFYGRIRARGLAAILILLDLLDGSRPRVTPATSANRGIKEFRSLIQGIEVNSESRLVVSVFGEDESLFIRGGVLKTVSKAASTSARKPTIQQMVGVLCKDLSKNRSRLQDLRNDLSQMGIGVNDWLLEYREHVFDDKLHETWETIFDLGYLERVAEQMWSLSRRVFGRSSFDYTNLAAALREPDHRRVKCAVRRLAVISASMKHNDRRCLGTGSECTRKRSSGNRGTNVPEVAGAIDANEQTWRWKISYKRDGKCKCAHRDDLLDWIRKLEKRHS